MKVTIQDKEFEFEYNWGSVYVYEDLTDKPINFRSHLSLHTLFYSILMFNNPDTFNMEFKEFVNLLEDWNVNKMLFEELSRQLRLKGQFIDGEDDKSDPSKKA